MKRGRPFKYSPKTLKEALYCTVHRSDSDIDEIADEMGVSANLLYRWCMDEDTTSFSPMPSNRILSLMKASGNEAVLDFLNRAAGRISFRVPKATLSKLDEGEMVEEYQTSTINAVKLFRDYITKPTTGNYSALKDALDGVMVETAKIDRYAEKKQAGQFEMELN